MRIFIAGIAAESNSFSPIPTDMASFVDDVYYHGDATSHPPSICSAPLHMWRKLAESSGHEVIESLCASASPGAPTSERVYEVLRDEVISDLAQAVPVDIVLLSLHGAMIALGYDDCEGDLLSRIRKLVPPKAVIAAELDLHCSITSQMIDAADILITYKHNPHTDFLERANEVFDLAFQTANGQVTPTMAVYDCRMKGHWRTVDGPMHSFVQKMQALEGRDGVLSISFAHGFARGDVPEMSAKVLTITDANAEKAELLAAQLGEEVWQIREEAHSKWLNVDEALERLPLDSAGPTVLADISDNAGSGAPSDSTVLLSAILSKGLDRIASGLYWDPMAVRFCLSAGEGAELTLRIGGKSCAASGHPLDLKVRVMKIIRNAKQPFGDSTSFLGDSVWVQHANDVDLVLTSNRKQTFHPQAFTQFGINLYDKRIITVKSAQHFYAGFEPVAAEIVNVDAGGAVGFDYKDLPFKKFTAPYWPKFLDPFPK